MAEKKTIGGIKAVIWTDAFQTLIMFSGVIAVIVKGTSDVGGFGNLVDINSEGGRLNFFNFDPNPFVRQSFWSLVIGGIILYFICNKFLNIDEVEYILIK